MVTKTRPPLANESATRSAADSDARWRLLVESIRDYAIFMLDVEGRVATWSLGAEQIKGYRADEIIGQHFSRFYPQEAQSSGWPQHELRVAAIEGRFEDEGWRIRKDGSRFWANVIITALRDPGGNLTGYAKITRDLTARLSHEELLRQSEERFRLLVERVEDYAIYMLDPNGQVMSWNAGAQRIKGYAASEIVGKHFSRFYPQDAIESGKPWRALAVARDKGRLQDEGLRVRKDGTTFWASVVITAVRDSEGHLRGFAKVTRDLTQSKQMEALEESGRRMTEFLAILSHELRNPLAPIRHMLGVMHGIELADPVMITARDVIEHQVSHLTRVVDDLLDVSRINRGIIGIRAEIIDLSTVISYALEAARPLIEARGHTLHLAPFDASLQVCGDLVRLSQVLVNLLNNAAKYTPSGGQIWLTVKRADGEIEISVRDNGKGISSELLERLFEFFTVAEHSLERAEGGLGIGLGLVKRLVELHGGRIEARSEGEGRGSEFSLRLPAATRTNALRTPAKADRAARAPSTHAKEPSTPRRILVVDDNTDSALSLSLLLQTMGHETTTANDGLEALEAVRTFSPDIVFLDIGLPKLNGYEVAQRLRTEAGDRHVLIALTGWGQEDDKRRAREAGFDHHLVKPVDAVELAKVIANARTPG